MHRRGGLTGAVVNDGTVIMTNFVSDITDVGL